MLLVILIYLIVLVPLALLVRTLSFTAYRWLFTILHGLWLTVLTLSCSNTQPLFLAEEAEALSIVTYLRQLFTSEKSNDQLNSTDNFLLVDVSMDTQLLTKPKERLFKKYGAVTSGVDRARLTTFLNLFIQDSVIGRSTELIVCDLLLDYPSTNARVDVSLQKSLTALNQQQKLLIADSAERFSEKTGSDPVSLQQAPVDFDLHDGLFFNYSLIDSAGRSSLPYKLYQLISNKRIISRPVPLLGRLIEERSVSDSTDRRVYWGLNTFIPELRIADAPIQDLVNPRETTWLDEFLSLVGFTPSAEETVLQTETPVYELGELLNKPDLLRKHLSLHQGKKTIVLIGSFKDPQRDVHQTAYGSMHGPLLLMNIYLNLVNGSHILSLSYLVFLITMFSWVSHQMLRKKINCQDDGLRLMLREWKEKLLNKRYVSKSNAEFSDTKNMSSTNSFPNTIAVMVGLKQRIIHVSKLIMEEAFLSKQPYWILLLILSISTLYFQHVINIMGLAIYIAAVDFSLRVLRQN